MPRFFPLYVRRSDGRSEIASKKRPESNGPTQEQLDRKADANGISDFYREVAEEEIKHQDWRRKLGWMLVKELGGEEHKDKNCILAALPEGYRLFEHVKCKSTEADENAQVVDSKGQRIKTHAGGGNERQDAYLYGHPIGRRKRFRSPADFFPHLLWLCTDEAGDPDNCTCKICAPDELQPEDKLPKPREIKKEPVKKESVQQEPVDSDKHPIVEIVKRPPSQQSQTPSIKPSPSPAPASNRPNVQPTTLPHARTLDQQIDTQYNQFMFRPGEIAWFNRGAAWGLGFITRRYAFQSSEHHVARRYVIQPLSHPLSSSPVITLEGDNMLRPWLAWSVPPFTCNKLNEMTVTYESADWHGIYQKRYGDGDAEVDGSILAAKYIDETFTLIQPLGKSTARPGAEETYWNAMYFGAEKVWLGDPVRLRIGSGLDIMVVTGIVEKARPAYGGNTLQKSVYVLGDIYTIATVPDKQSPPSNTQLPLRLDQDLRFRNSCTGPTKGTLSYWKLISAGSRLDLSDIKGRWYEASLLLPMIQGSAAFQESARKGDISDASLLMNGRGDCNTSGNGMKAGSAGVRKAERKEALGRAVPAGTTVVDGVTPPSDAYAQMAITAETETTMNQNDEVIPDQGGSLEDFMNLDSIEHESMPGFGQEYGSQNQDQGFY
ncbi:hypothetical protein EV356DRAFT_504357 [Viridothelium virens]|uniref:Cryptic loci regulator 2 N-terminal domain-containing protein n=1 Tax=Viridothelium virens TaxID=1048519 RepID=A0A6A6HN86_VIRVR|nr:hypothetical protein EV356DRAFT_504357 [Viridothelium virens]